VLSRRKEGKGGPRKAVGGKRGREKVKKIRRTQGEGQGDGLCQGHRRKQGNVVPYTWVREYGREELIEGKRHK